MWRRSSVVLPHLVGGVSVAARGNSPGGCGGPSVLFLCIRIVPSYDASSILVLSQATVASSQPEKKWSAHVSQVSPDL